MKSSQENLEIQGSARESTSNSKSVHALLFITNAQSEGEFDTSIVIKGTKKLRRGTSQHRNSYKLSEFDEDMFLFPITHNQFPLCDKRRLHKKSREEAVPTAGDDVCSTADRTTPAPRTAPLEGARNNLKRGCRLATPQEFVYILRGETVRRWRTSCPCDCVRASTAIAPNWAATAPQSKLRFTRKAHRLQNSVSFAHTSLFGRFWISLVKLIFPITELIFWSIMHHYRSLQRWL